VCSEGCQSYEYGGDCGDRFGYDTKNRWLGYGASIKCYPDGM
jgi:hypothetical protein